jgi:UDP-galactopyranose mutase
MMKNILIVGAGISGATIARELANKGYTITIIEKRNHIAGNCYDYVNKSGILMNKYGPHLFHTNSERVWSYVNQFSEWTPWKHKVYGCIDNVYFPVPVNIDSVNILCGTDIKSEDEMKSWLAEHTIPCSPEGATNSEEVALARVGPELYEKVFKGYTVKQWNKTPAELAPSVLERIPVKTNWDPYYFSDKYQALPSKGYTSMVKSMLDHPNITVHIEKDYTHDMNLLYDYVFYTGPIDTYYASSGYEKLEYRSLHFHEETLQVDQFQPLGQVNYPSVNQPFTRIIEYKHFLNQHVPNVTTIVYEQSTSEGEPYYPVPTKHNQDIYRKYQALATEDEKNGIFFVGRLATYKYYNMDAAILAALEAVDKFLSVKHM